MWTPGEKQFYVFALLETLLNHLPGRWRVGALYDIGCQMDQSLKKWKFRPEWLPRFEWGVSIFHAYGHQWGMPALSIGVSQMVKDVSDFGANFTNLSLGCGSQKENLKDAIAEGINLVEGESTASNLVQAEWQEKVQLLREAIQHLEGTIKKKTDELWLSDRTSAAELSQLKRDKWVNVQLNLRVLREQLLRKLRARKFELATLDHANSSRILDQKTKAHVEKAVKSRSGGIEATVKKYNAKLKELVALRGKGGIRRGAYVPPMLTMEGLYQLDVDQDIWEDSRVKEGIRLSQEIANCRQELERCKAEHANLQTWFCEEYSRVMEVFMGSEDEDVSYFALHQANQLYEWMTAWKKDMVQVPISSGAPSWDNICRPLPMQEHHAVWTQVQHEMEFDATAISDLQPPLTTRRNERSSADYDSDASSDDTEGGELEESFKPQEASLIVAMDQASVEEA
ncbi:hypothetical protein BS47DRAFT_1358860 [Hydnum rufescens UP504]|uniref:Uncharacterized protein n=1 Tax=Hydnum rufescens UP504 TaxID=1448309 RepID=A0A9P6E1I8_9AGAM|nr:hypothetical protein BS47DRAFT_1358860 [Hydnum rufescens UP504]